MSTQADFRSLFWAQVQKGHDCWLWTGLTNGRHSKGGYGHIRRGRRRWEQAHRVSWELTNGPIPNGLYVLHHCDNRLCVRPEHLFLGTQKDNLKDCVRKGRAKFAHVPGERNGRAKLTGIQAVRIRALYADGGWTHVSLARLLGVSKSLIGAILLRQLWRHI